MKSLYYQFVNFVQTTEDLTFAIFWFLTFAVILIYIVKFFKIYNGTQKKFEKLSYIVIAVLLFTLLIYLTYLRK